MNAIDWIKSTPNDSQRAALAGYDVEPKCYASILKSIVEKAGIQNATVIHEGQRDWDWYAWDKRKSPSDEALDLETSVKAALEKVLADYTFDDCIIEYEFVARVTYAPTYKSQYGEDIEDEDKAEKYSACIVTLCVHNERFTDPTAPTYWHDASAAIVIRAEVK